MMKRRQIREIIFRLLFVTEFHQEEEKQEQIDFYFENHPLEDEEDEIYIRQRIASILPLVPELDARISEVTEGWELSRIGRAELSLLRLAVYEMKEDDDIPVKVAINEAVELSKVYCSREAPRFINGILAKLV